MDSNVSHHDFLDGPDSFKIWPVQQFAQVLPDSGRWRWKTQTHQLIAVRESAIWHTRQPLNSFKFSYPSQHASDLLGPISAIFGLLKPQRCFSIGISHALHLFSPLLQIILIDTHESIHIP